MRLGSCDLADQSCPSFCFDCGPVTRLQLSSGVLAQAEVETQTPEYEVCDTLKVIALVSHFRSRGHLVAQLDPLQRVPYGTWHKDGDAEAVW